MFDIGRSGKDDIRTQIDNMKSFAGKSLEGFACSASDNSCVCGWDCSSTKT